MNSMQLQLIVILLVSIACVPEKERSFSVLKGGFEHEDTESEE